MELLHPSDLQKVLQRTVRSRFQILYAARRKLVSKIASKLFNINNNNNNNFNRSKNPLLNIKLRLFLLLIIKRA